MSKLFPISIEVEQDAVGRVMLLLNKTPGVAKFHLDMDRVAKPNGADKGNSERKPYKPRGSFDVSGEDVALAALYKGIAGRPQLMQAFTAQGRAPSSINSVLHKLRQSGDVHLADDGMYSLTKKARDRLRHRKSAKKK
jgi:hypothetical protein